MPQKTIKRMETKPFLIILALFTTFISLAQTTYYVDQTNGSNTNNGTSPSSAYETFDKAATQVNPGDTISIMGEYHNTSYNPNYSYPTNPDPKINAADAHVWHKENSININGLNGSASAYISIRGYDANSVLKGDGANILRVRNSSYLKFENLMLEGEVDRIDLEDVANKLQFVYVLGSGVTNPSPSDIHFRNEDEVNDNDGIVEETDIYTALGDVTRPSYIDTRGMYFTGCENIITVNNTIHHTPGGGVRFASCKYIAIIGNELYLCSARSYSGTHALVVTKTEPIGNNGYCINIQKNHVHHNYNEQFSWAPTKTIITPRIDEGKGISLQRNNISDWINGSGRILVENNLCFWNGFSGVHSNDGHRIDFINNTCYMNSYSNTVTYANTTQKGNNIGVSAQGGNDIKMINNISVVDTDWGGFALSSGDTSNLVVIDNLIFGVNGTVNQDADITSIAVNTSVGDPLFVNAPIPYQNENSSFDFNLLINSPAIDAANTSYAPSDDFFSIERDANPDLGAIEYNPNLSAIDFIADEISVFPNPFYESIQIDGIDSAKNIEIFTTTGKKINLAKESIIIDGSSTILLLSDLNTGFYILKADAVIRKIVKINP